MCGIAGVILKSGGADPEILDRLTRALAHRGPDGTGTFADGGNGLVHTRLVIIDLETGDQPLTDDAGSQLIVNGEIYNFVELKQEIGLDQFKTKSDCEVVLPLMRRDGAGFGPSLRGMYAVAATQQNGKPTYLARDPFGIKPLYYMEDSRGLYFSSEPKAMFAAGLGTPQLDNERRDEFLQIQFTSGAETIYRGVRRVLPGETLTVEEGRVTARAHLHALPPGGPENISESEAIKRVGDALMDSVRVHQRSDVPYGMFLSGGIDSSVILACMRELNDRPVEAFTVGFSGTGVSDERAHAQVVARAAGANFHPVEFSEDDFWSLLPSVVAAFDDPIADYAILPTFKLGMTLAEHGLKVVLSGEGGDEMFAGYGRYRRLLRPWWLGGRPMRQRGILEGLNLLRAQPVDWRAGIRKTEDAVSLPGRSKLQIAQAVDCADWLPHDLLLKLDRCLMAHGVEGRTPMLDPVVASVASTLPDRLKVRGRQGKYVLRKWLDQNLPEAEPFARKRGFTVPVAEWIGKNGRRIGELVVAAECIGELCDPGRVVELFAGLEGNIARHHGQAAWILLFYALWHRVHIDGALAEGDTFDVLSAAV
ncbi:MAG: asparagine synthase (glutamine-hydrolyzing) [Rhodospirillales bacterium]|nr:asparagine synthase (glutamine-hydrolyzing) [Rhodospirillales bacterium]MDP6645540.1 asparagine synthase (glutamine-hydrolyzing) [Rhodospirillales bacterium]MDP6840864.1 asparagine synthase (glutamine-hydrolyzing) [Rhodospirillales bacterium]